MITQHQTAGTAVALGYFDGVHLGHRRILRAAVDWAAANRAVPAAFTFTFGVRRTKTAQDLLTVSERRRRLLALGLQDICCPAFDTISGLSPAQFVQQILDARLGARAVFCGENFRFGAGAAGDVALLRQLCEVRGIEVHVFPLLEVDGQPVSSTRIRGLLAAGDLAQVTALLGEAYAEDLPVHHGQGVGGKLLGYPTVNQRYPAELQRPAPGVYRTAALINGQWVAGATGFGDRPSIAEADGSLTCETFLCGWQGNAYGHSVRVCFLEYLWPVRHYDDLQQLRACIAEAAKLSAEAFAKEGPPAD